MNKYGTFLAGSALLATTALVSGTVHAASIVTGTGATSTTTAAFSAFKLGTSLFAASTSSAVNVSNASFEIKSTISYTTQVTRSVILIGGAEFDAGATSPTVSIGNFDTTAPSASLTNMSAAGTANVTVFTDRLIIGALTSTFQVIHVASPTIKNLQALGTPGASVTLSGRIENPSVSATYENIDAGTLFTSVTSGAIVFTTVSGANGIPSASLNSQASVTVSPPFVSFGSNAGATILTATVGSVSMTIYGGLSTNLTATLSGTNLISTAELRITHGALADPAFNSLSIKTSANIQTKTITQIASGVATFTLTGASFAETTGAIVIDIGVVGSTAITGGSGTGAVTVTPTGTSLATIATTTGNLVSITKGGLSSSVNTFQNSFNSVPSFLRITNSGGVAGTYTITIRNGDSASGAILGTYTGGTVQPNGTIQLSAVNLETGASITAPTSLGNYQLAVAAAFNGYIQHLTYSNSTGVLSNLSAFRQGGSLGGTQLAP